MEYKKCLVELDEILKYLSDEDISKIPYEIKRAITEEKDKQYTWNYDESKELSEQNINRKTIAMLSYLNMEYLLNEEQKMLIEKLHEFNEKKIEKENVKKYNSNNIFRNDNLVEEQNKAILIEAKKDKWYQRILSFFRKIKNGNTNA